MPGDTAAEGGARKHSVFFLTVACRAASQHSRAATRRAGSATTSASGEAADFSQAHAPQHAPSILPSFPGPKPVTGWCAPSPPTCMQAGAEEARADGAERRPGLGRLSAAGRAEGRVCGELWACVNAGHAGCTWMLRCTHPPACCLRIFAIANQYLASRGCHILFFLPLPNSCSSFLLALPKHCRASTAAS